MARHRRPRRRDAQVERAVDAGSSGPGTDQGVVPGAETDRPLSLEQLRARQERSTYGAGSRGRAAPAADGVLIQVCLTCGREYTFDTEPPPPDLECEKCGQRVFRSYFDIAGRDEVIEDHRASTERDVAPDDAESDVTLDDIMDLNNP